MRTYRCTCENILFFDNSRCLHCGSEVGYCPACRLITALVPAEDHFQCGNTQCNAQLVKCANYAEFQVCNRCVEVSADTYGPADPRGLCDCCRFNDTIPDLSVEGNQRKWARLEAAKRRLFYDLKLLELPYGTESDGVEPSLAFDFKADVIPDKNYWRCSDEEERVYTGHADGRITINIREADDVEREKLRVVMGETQRTLIGHFRHEIGHYYWDLLVKGKREAECKEVFGDHENPTYAEALDAYYQNGPAADWQTRLISGYASMHPWEDFAETWAAYLDLVSVLDTATHQNLGMVSHPLETDLQTKVTQYQSLGISLNEINRSLGLLDAVPEIFVSPVVEKLRFIHQIIREAKANLSGSEPPTPSPEIALTSVTAAN